MILTTSDLIDRMAEPLEPGSAEWAKTVSASKVAAIMGLSPWQSLFTVWHTMAGNLEAGEGNTATERGTYLEPAILAWFRDTHPELDVFNGAMFRHPEHHDWTANPDSIATDGVEPSGVEAKSAQYSEDWGAEGTAEIPVYYLAQVAWQMIVTGLRKVWVPVLFGSPFKFALYVVTWDDVTELAGRIIPAVEAFQASLASNTAPPLDGSTSTYQSVRELHPEIDGEIIELPDELAVLFIRANEANTAAAENAQHAKNTIADYMGTAKKAVWHGATIFTRQSKNGGTPYLVAGRKLPAPTQETAA